MAVLAVDERTILSDQAIDAEDIRRSVERCRAFREFIRESWAVIEPTTPYVHGFHVDAIGEHMEAVLRRDIRNLLITIPPRMMKSTIISVMFPAFAWTQEPSARFLTSSYSGDLALRDAVRSRRLISSPWYQARWGHLFRMRGDQNVASRYENDRTGYRIARGRTAAVTGDGGDFVMCLPYGELVRTERGPVAIGELVHRRDAVRVATVNLATGALGYASPSGWHINPGRPIYELGLDDGATVRLTADHRVWTRRGWVQAGQLTGADLLPCVAGDAVGDAEPLRHRAHAADSRADSRAFGVREPGAATAVEEGVADAAAEGAIALGVGNVLGAGAVAEVFDPVVRAHVVQVTDIAPGRARSDEGERDALVDEELNRLAVAAGVEPGVSLRWRREQDAARLTPPLRATDNDARFTPHAAERGHAVESIESGDRRPLFFRHVGFAPLTYCLTVGPDRNFVTADGIIAKNCDDPHNVREAHSESIRQDTLDWWDQAMSNRINDPKRSCRVVIQQRVHEGDLAGHLLEQGGYEHLNLPMEYEPTTRVTAIGWRDPRTEPGQLLSPDRFGPQEAADAKRRHGAYGWAGQFQQRPAPAEGGIFKQRHWRFWQHPGQSLQPYRIRLAGGEQHECALVTLPVQFDRWAQSWDMTFGNSARERVRARKGQETEGSYVVGQVWAGRGPDAFLIDQYREQVGFNATLAAFLTMADEYPHVLAKYIENKANGPAIIDAVSAKVGGIIEIEPRGTKQERAMAIQPLVEAGNVYLPHPANEPWVEEFIHEFANFPNGRTDDQVDAASQLLDKWSVAPQSVVAAPSGDARASIWTALDGYTPSEEDE